MKKKFFSFLISICMLLPCALALAGCTKDDDSSKVMNISLNPEVEFVLNKENKVVSVNALDDDGNHIVSLAFNQETAKSAFEGLSAEEAMNMFLDLAEENGYLITGDEEQISIKISGEADKLMKSVKNKAQAFFDENNLSVNITTGKIDKAEIEAKVKDCLQEYTSEQLASMSQEELIELLKTSRKETADLFTQDLKDAYYSMRIKKINTAELESLYELISDETSAFYDTLMEIDGFSTLVANLKTLIDSVDNLEKVYKENFLTGNDDPTTLNYFEAKQEYVKAKEDLLKQRLTLTQDGELSEADKESLVPYQTAVTDAIAKMEELLPEAQTALEEAQTTLNEAMQSLQGSNLIIEMVKSTLNLLHVDLVNIYSAASNMLNGFKNHFKTEGELKDFVGKNNAHWSQQTLQPVA